jgi:hypothetical protein
MATKTEVMKKIIELQKQRKDLKIERSKTKDKTLIKELDAKLAETVKTHNALTKEYESAVDDESKTYAKPE